MQFKCDLCNYEPDLYEDTVFRQQMMELRLFLTHRQDIVVEQKTRPRISYFLHVLRRLFSSPPLKVWRGPPELSSPFGSIVKQRTRPTCVLITLDESGETITLRQQRLWASQRLFEFKEKKYMWHNDQDLLDLQSGEVIAELQMKGRVEDGKV